MLLRCRVTKRTSYDIVRYRRVNNRRDQCDSSCVVVSFKKKLAPVYPPKTMGQRKGMMGMMSHRRRKISLGQP
ncbi:hypothetical protein E2C01_093800 [Portunus trituberculatus]|uniref:Uncharacterized protein n=1 Tax=Portunus trituberculatus TaxID=210409 RepID=A0A5B7JUG0_PORTR|nr:hypothetical protein [Portunus trituberculatus]